MTAVAACSAAVLSSLAMVPAVRAAEAPDDVVTVTATRQPVRASQVVAEVTVIDRAALERAQGQTLPQLLAEQAGLQLSGNGGAGKTTSVFIRGLEARHTLLLVDGMPVTSATVGSPSLDNLPLELFERIEIVRGPMSSLYGNGAMGGVIQLFTRRAASGLSASALAGAGTQRSAVGAAGVAAGDGRWFVAANAQRQTTAGWSSTNPRVPFGQYNPDRDGFAQTAASAKLGWQIAGGWRAEALALSSEGDTRIDDGPGADAIAGLRNRVGRLALDARLAAGWDATLAASESTDAYETIRSASAFASLGTIETVQRRLSLEQRIATPLGSLLALAERTTQTVSRPGTPFTVSERDIDAVALALSGSAGAQAWQASLRRDRNSQFGGITTGAAGWSWAFEPGWRLFASAGTSHTLPSFNQLYFPSFGNPLLLPEKGRHVEAGVQRQLGGQTLRATAYRHVYRGFITAGPQPVNLPKAEIDGLSFSWDAQWDAWAVDASFDATTPRNATEGTANFGKRLPRRAAEAARLGVQWSRGAWQLGGRVQAFSSRFDDAANAVRLGGHATVGLDARWAFAPGWSLGLRLDNAFDRAYETALGYEQPRRAVLATLRWAMR